MTSNYLETKYPKDGYKKEMEYPVSSDKYFSGMKWKTQTKEQYLKQQEEEKRIEEKLKIYNSIKKLPMINVCVCGAEWENKFAKYQEGCYPYIEAECQECKLDREKEEKRKAIELKRIKRIEEFENILPPRYRGKLGVVLNDKLLTSTCSIVWGGFGTGKTWECYTLAKNLIESEEIKTFRLLTEIDLLNNLKSDFDYMDDKISYYKNLDLLIIDEAGKNNDSDFNKAQLFGILNHRYDWEKKTVLICNAKSKEEIRELLPTAILDRFRECVVEMNGQSKRYKE